MNDGWHRRFQFPPSTLAVSGSAATTRTFGLAALTKGAVKPVVMALGVWGMQWVYDGLDEAHLNVVVLLREISVFLRTEHLPAGDTALQFTFTDLDARPKQYILIQGDKREACDDNPGYEVDVYLRSTLHTLTEIWWGDRGLLAAINAGDLQVSGAPACTRNIAKWFPVSSFAKDNRNFRS
jgi:hypothetical protein